MTLPLAALSPEDTPDQLLDRVAKLRDKAAFSVLFERFSPHLNAYMRQKGASPTAAEELVQEAMLSVWRQADQFDPEKATASTWIFTIARNKRIDQLRRQNHIEIDWSDPALVLPSDDRSDHGVLLSDQQQAISAAIATLPPEQAELLKLSFFEDMPHIEIARRRNLPLGTVKSRLRLAIDKLRLHLTGKEV